MPALRDIQSEFRGALLGRDDAFAATMVCGDGIAPSARLRIYRHHVLTTLTAVLKATYPVVCRLVDERFFDYVVDCYIHARPPYLSFAKISSRPPTLAYRFSAEIAGRWRRHGRNDLSVLWLAGGPQPGTTVAPHAHLAGAGPAADYAARFSENRSPMITALLHLLRLCPFLVGGRRQLVLENVALRQQLAVYKRAVKRPKLRRTDRLFWVVLSRLWTGWRKRS
jgi:hypothetical protein